MAVAAAFFAAAPLGRVLGPPLAEPLGAGLTVGVVLATVLAFLFLYVLVRALVTALFRRASAGRDPESRGLDRLLGGALGGSKAAALAWLGPVRRHLLRAQPGGRRRIPSPSPPRDSVLVALARRYNVVEWLQFPGVEGPGRALAVASDLDVRRNACKTTPTTPP